MAEPKKKRGRPPKSGVVVKEKKQATSALVHDEEVADQRIDDVQQACSLLTDLLQRKSNRVCNFKTMEQIRQDMLAVPNFAFQWLINAYGLPANRHIDIIGAEALGKTSLALTLLGWIMKYSGAYGGMYLETENKPMPFSRARRAFSSDPVEAERMAKTVIFDSARSLSEMEEKIELWASVMRGERADGKKSVCVPMHIPLPCVVDTWSKLMSKNEEVGFYAYGDNMKDASKKQAVGTGSNFGHSKFAQGWARRLPYLMDRYNIQLILNWHQNDKVDMGGGSSFMSAETGALYNKTKIGGRALNQNAAIQFIVAPLSQVKNSGGTVISRRVKIRVEKNSYGPGGRVIEADIRMDNFADTPGYLEPFLNFDDFLARWFTDEKLCDTTAASKRYSSKIIGVLGANASEFANAFHANKVVMDDLGLKLGIEGYDTIVNDIKEDIDGQ